MPSVANEMAKKPILAIVGFDAFYGHDYFPNNMMLRTSVASLLDKTNNIQVADIAMCCNDIDAAEKDIAALRNAFGKIPILIVSAQNVTKDRDPLRTLAVQNKCGFISLRSTGKQYREALALAQNMSDSRV